MEVLRYGIGAAVQAAYWESRLLCGLVTPPESPRVARECPPAPARKQKGHECSRALVGATRACLFSPRAKSRADGVVHLADGGAHLRAPHGPGPLG